MLRREPMHRLLQGDVGAGKTIVALLAAIVAMENGLQVAFMAPTEILAAQHFRQHRAPAVAVALSRGPADGQHAGTRRSTRCTRTSSAGPPT